MATRLLTKQQREKSLFFHHSLFSIIKYLFGMTDRQTDGVGGSKTNLCFLLFANISVA